MSIMSADTFVTAVQGVIEEYNERTGEERRGQGTLRAAEKEAFRKIIELMKEYDE